MLLADLLSRFDIEGVDPTGLGPEVDRAVLGHGRTLDTARGEGPEPLSGLEVIRVGLIGGGAAHEHLAVGDSRRTGAVIAGLGARAQRILPEHLTGLGIEAEDAMLVDLLTRLVVGPGG